MFFGKPWSEWIAEYAESHQNPTNRVLHTLGIPMIAVSILLVLIMPIIHLGWTLPVLLFILGWIFQFVGHVFEGKKPEFFRDWRFLFVGLRWWFAKISGKV